LKRALGLVAVVVAVLLILPPMPHRLRVLSPLLLLPPRLRVLAIALAVIAVLVVVGLYPRLRAAWQCTDGARFGHVDGRDEPCTSPGHDGGTK
jgi:hypothetical protein